MKILMMTNTYTPPIGGLERSVQLFTEEFRKLGNRVVVVVPEYEGAPKNEYGVVRLPAIRHVTKADFSVNLPFPGTLEKLFHTYRPDIVHAHHPFLVGDLALRMCGQYGIPLVYTYHILFDQYGHYLPVNTEGTRRFVEEISTGYANLSDHVIAPSRSISQFLRERGVVTPISVVPTGVDHVFYSRGNREKFRAQYHIPRDAFVLGYAGRLVPEKNIQFLASVMAALARKYPKVHCLIAGTGSSEPDIRNVFRIHDVLGRLHLAGNLSHDRLAGAYRSMDIFTFSSKSETQGMVIAEAMASGLPVVALKASAVGDMVVSGRNGYLIEDEDEEAFIDALIRIMELPAGQRAALSERALRSALPLSSDKCARKMLKIYTDLVSRKREKTVNAENDWVLWMNRLKTEWGMLENFGQATAKALQTSFQERSSE